MQWTVRLEARTDQGEVETTELVTFNRPVVDGTLAALGLALSEAKAVLAKLQVIMVQSHVADYTACHRSARNAGCRSPSRTGARVDCRPCSARSRWRHLGSGSAVAVRWHPWRQRCPRRLAHC